MHGVFRVERRTAARKSQLFTRFWRNLSVISLLLKEFRRLNAIFIAFYTPNVVHGVFSFEISTAARKSQTCTRFWRSQSVISLLLEIFRRSIAIYIAFYTPIVVHAFPSVEMNRLHRKCQSFIELSKIMSYFSSVWDISTFKRSFHIIIHAERSARIFRRRNEPISSQISIIRGFWQKLCIISVPFEIFRTINALFSPFYMQNAVHAFSSVEATRSAGKSQSFFNFD